MRFVCPGCTKTYRLPPDRIGPSGKAQISCPNCRAVVLVKTAGGEDLECQLQQGGTNSGIVVAAPAAASGPAPAAQPAASRPISGAFEPESGPWYVVVGRDKAGPLSAAQIAAKLAAGELTIHSLAWHKGMANWTRIEDLPELLKAMAAGSVRKSGGFAPVAAAAPPQPAAPAQPASAARPQAAPVPAPAARAQAQSSAPAQAAPAAAQAAARNLSRLNVVQAVGQPRAEAASPIKPQPSQPIAAVPPAKPLSKQEFDDAGPTLEAALPLPTGRPAPGPAAPAKVATIPQLAGKSGPSGGKGKGVADAHGDAFFAAGHDLNDVELSLPDPNKHKPTKEEYQNLIQEFSVMFRLDKRSKRQKVLIGVVLAAMLVTAVSFGVVLTMQGNAKRQLIRDSKEILAAFDLGYRTAVVPSAPQETAVAAQPGQPASAAKADAPKEVSQIADKIANMVAKKKKPKAVAVAANTGHGSGAGLSEAEAAAAAKKLQEAEAEKARKQAEALAKANELFGGRKETAVGGVALGVQAIEDGEVRKLCKEKAGQIASCAEKAGANPSALKISITAMGGVGTVVAIADGKANDELGSCIRQKMSGVAFGRQPAPKTVECKVN